MPTSADLTGNRVLHRRGFGSADPVVARRPARPHRFRRRARRAHPGAACSLSTGRDTAPLPCPSVPLRAVQFGDLLVEFADLLDLRNLVVVGNSVGGYAACRLALEREDRVSGVVLVNTGGFTPHSVFTRFLCAVMGRPAVVRAVFPAFVRAYMHAKTSTDKAVVTRVVGRAKTPTVRKPLPHCGRASPNPGTTCGRVPPASQRPVLITWGAKDLTAPLRVGAGRSPRPFRGRHSRSFRPDTSCSRPSLRPGWRSVLPFADAAHGVRHGVTRRS